MPTTAKGKKILSAMKKQYGIKKGKAIYYASIVKGKIKGAEGKGTGRLEKAKRTYKKKNKKKFNKTNYDKARKRYFKLK
jgi:hypothetical protein